MIERLSDFIFLGCVILPVSFTLNCNFVIYKAHQQLNGHKFEKTPGDNGKQGILACCSPWGLKMSGTI